MFRNKETTNFSKTIPVLVTDQGLPTSTDTIQLLEADGVSTIGVYKYDSTDKRLEATTSALALTDTFSIAQNRGLLPDGSAFAQIMPFKGTAGDYKVKKTAYSANTKQRKGIGYISPELGGTLNVTTVASKDIFSVSIEDLNLRHVPKATYSFQSVATASSTLYSVMSELAKNISNPNNAAYHPFKSSKGGVAKFRALLKTDEVTAGALAANAVVVKGSNSITVTAHGRAVGDYVLLGTIATDNEDLYRITAVPTVNTITLDRVYSGVSGTLTAATQTGYILSATVDANSDFGLQIEPTDVFSEVTFELSSDLALEEATKATLTNWNKGSGAGVDVYELERRAIGVFGMGHANEARPELLTKKANYFAEEDAFYTIYHIYYKGGVKDSNRPYSFDEKNSVMIAVKQADASTVSTLFDTIFTNILVA